MFTLFSSPKTTKLLFKDLWGLNSLDFHFHLKGHQEFCFSDFEASIEACCVFCNPWMGPSLFGREHFSQTTTALLTCFLYTTLSLSGSQLLLVSLWVETSELTRELRRKSLWKIWVAWVSWLLLLLLPSGDAGKDEGARGSFFIDLVSCLDKDLPSFRSLLCSWGCCRSAKLPSFAGAWFSNSDAIFFTLSRDKCLVFPGKMSSSWRVTGCKLCSCCKESHFEYLKLFAAVASQSRFWENRIWSIS